MGIAGLLPFLEKASKKGNISEFSGCSVAIDSYCWLHKGAFACADKLVRGEQTDMHIKYCMKYVNMLLSRNIKPILVFDGRHLPAKALTESKRRESRDVAKKRAAELLRLGQVDEARSYMRRCVDITHEMALALIKECRARGVDCIVAPYEADAQLAHLNIKNIAQVVITEDSDLILFGCTKVFFKMDLDGNGTLVDACKLPLAMKCPIEKYRFSQFRRMCILSGCDYLASLPGIGLAKARQFVTTTQDDDFANALKKLPSFFNKSSLVVSDEYRVAFLRAEATFLHQLVYCPLARQLVPLTDPHDEGTEPSLCSNAGEMLDPDIAFQLALGNLDPFSLRKMDDWHPDHPKTKPEGRQSAGWNQAAVSGHTSIWSPTFSTHLQSSRPWAVEPKRSLSAILTTSKSRNTALRLPRKVIPETQEFDSLTIENLSEMYSEEPVGKKPKLQKNLTLSIIEDSQPSALASIARNPFAKTTGKYQTPQQIIVESISESVREVTVSPRKERSPILENKERSFKRVQKNGSYSVLKKLSNFQRTVVDEENVVQSKFFNSAKDKVSDDECSSGIYSAASKFTIDEENPVFLSQKENYSIENRSSDINETVSNNKSTNRIHSAISMEDSKSISGRTIAETVTDLSQDSVIENTYPHEGLIAPTDSQLSLRESCAEMSSSDWKSKDTKPTSSSVVSSRGLLGLTKKVNGKAPVSTKLASCRVPGLSKRPANQPTLLAMFSFQKKQMVKK